MHIIPVIDLMGGQVVHARAGQRRAYRPLQSALAASSAPLEVLNGLLSLHAFATIYIADLDAICGKDTQASVLQSIRQAHPRLGLWLDAGADTVSLCRSLVNFRPVLGTESLASLGDMQTILAEFPDAVLSLDFQQNRFIGDPRIFQCRDIWPHDIIIMDLDRVGGRAGTAPLHQAGNIDIDRHDVYLAGGVRDPDDLHAIRAQGAHGVLLATALHDQSITAADLAVCA